MIEKRAIVAGHICLDITPDLSSVPEGQFQSLLQPGKMIQTGRFSLEAGGAVANSGLALHRLGVSTQLIGKIGDDLYGKALLEILRQAHAKPVGERAEPVARVQSDKPVLQMHASFTPHSRR